MNTFNTTTGRAEAVEEQLPLALQKLIVFPIFSITYNIAEQDNERRS
ncbi:MAG: hypothetical protein HOP23_02200 [Methylococcaceae bacterium]|nr:hypothetical protein [Methylococcaceae bacterium]